VRIVQLLMPCPVVAAIIIACDEFDAHYNAPPPPMSDASDGEGGCVTPDAGNATWTALYADFFGPTGTAQCGASSRGDSNGSTSCHHDSGGNGAMASGFICGDTQQSCYAGITSSMASFGGAQVVIPGDPCNSFLPKILRRNGGGIMPFYPMSVFFSDNDMARVREWIAAGAQNN
jgi:hypothetical protein